MKKISASFLMAFTAAFFSFPVANAATLKAAENLMIAETISDDAYLVAGSGNINADVAGDLYIAGGSVTINGNVGQDLVVAGGKVTVMGNVTGDIRLLGGQLAVYGQIGEDIVVAGGTVDIGKSSLINGDLVTSAGILTVDGEVKGNIKGLLGMFLLNGTVGNNVIITIEDQMNISPSAKISGNLEYSSILETKVPQGVVQGSIKFNKFEKDGLLATFTYWFFIEKIFSFFSALLLVLLYVIFAPKALINSAELAEKSVLKAFGIGLLSIIAAVVGALLLIVTVIGIPLALIIAAVLLITFYMAQVFVAAWLGGYLFDYKKNPRKLKLFGILTLSMLIYQLIGLIPYVGWAINLVLFLLGVGSIVMMKIEFMKLLKSKNKL